MKPGFPKNKKKNDGSLVLGEGNTEKLRKFSRVILPAREFIRKSDASKKVGRRE